MKNSVLIDSDLVKPSIDVPDFVELHMAGEQMLEPNPVLSRALDIRSSFSRRKDLQTT